jgi:hypothetical protein
MAEQFGEKEMHSKFLFENLKGKSHFGFIAVAIFKLVPNRL